MLNEETIKILKEISDECVRRNRKALKYHVDSCEGCQYYLPNMPDEEECLFFHGPCAWDDYLKIIIDRMKQEENDD